MRRRLTLGQLVLNIIVMMPFVCIVAFIAGLYSIESRDRSSCDSKGGVYIHAKCVKKEALL